MADKNMEAQISVEFEEATSRQSLNSGETINTLWGKVKRWLSDLKAVAFSGSYNDLSDKPTTATTDTDGLMSSSDKNKLDNADDTYALKSKYGDTTINVGRKAGTAGGIRSTAEGWNTTASGDYSHAGGLYTKALHHYEVAYGRYNVSNDDTLFSIGDGTSDSARHNAFEITKTGGKLHDKDIATTNQIVNNNLLINPDFKINQRGATSYSTDWGYTVDRWVLFGAVASPNSSGGINISKKDNAGYFGFIQRTEVLHSDFAGKHISLSAKIDGSVLSGTIIREDAEQLFFNIGETNDRFIISSYINNNIKYILVQFYGSKSYNIEWVKLEYGSVATPFIPPDPSTELLKCMRYYEILMPSGVDRAVTGYLETGRNAIFDMKFSVPKRCVPSLTSNSARIIVNTFDAYLAILNNCPVNQGETDKNGIVIASADPVISSDSSGYIGVSMDALHNADLAVDAEIY